MIVVALVSLLPAALIGLIVFLIAKRFASSITSVITAGVVGFAFATAFGSPTLNWIVSKSTNTELDSNAALAPEVMRTHELPVSQISDFCYQTSLTSSSPIADFRMSQHDFTGWMAAEGWHPQEFNAYDGRVQLQPPNIDTGVSASLTATVYPLRSGGGQEEHVVKHGLLVRERVGDSIRMFIYDVASERVYFSHSIY